MSQIQHFHNFWGSSCFRKLVHSLPSVLHTWHCQALLLVMFNQEIIFGDMSPLVWRIEIAPISQSTIGALQSWTNLNNNLLQLQYQIFVHFNTERKLANWDHWPLLLYGFYHMLLIFMVTYDQPTVCGDHIWSLGFALIVKSACSLCDSFMTNFITKHFCIHTFGKTSYVYIKFIHLTFNSRQQLTSSIHYNNISYIRTATTDSIW